MHVFSSLPTAHASNKAGRSTLNHKRKMHSLIIASAIILSGCATARPPLAAIGGHWFFVGDDECALQVPVSSTRIICSTKKREVTGYREALTEQQLHTINMRLMQVHSARQQRQIEMDQLNQSLRQAGEAFQRSGQQILQQSQQYSAPTVQPITPY